MIPLGTVELSSVGVSEALATLERLVVMATFVCLVMEVQYQCMASKHFSMAAESGL